MLKHVPSFMDAELLWVLAAMGHGDELVVVDRNFPAQSVAMETQSGKLITLGGMDAPTSIGGILELMPLDSFVEAPLALVATVVIIVGVKAALAWGIVRAFRQPDATALAVAAGRAQIGEFSFILIGLGIEIHLVPPQERVVGEGSTPVMAACPVDGLISRLTASFSSSHRASAAASVGTDSPA